MAGKGNITIKKVVEQRKRKFTEHLADIFNINVLRLVMEVISRRPGCSFGL